LATEYLIVGAGFALAYSDVRQLRPWLAQALTLTQRLLERTAA